MYVMVLHNLLMTYWTNRDELIGVIHHGDEQIEQDDYVDHWECTKHKQTEKSGEFFDAC